MSNQKGAKPTPATKREILKKLSRRITAKGECPKCKGTKFVKHRCCLGTSCENYGKMVCDNCDGVHL